MLSLPDANAPVPGAIHARSSGSYEDNTPETRRDTACAAEEFVAFCREGAGWVLKHRAETRGEGTSNRCHSQDIPGVPRAAGLVRPGGQKTPEALVDRPGTAHHHPSWHSASSQSRS